MPIPKSSVSPYIDRIILTRDRRLLFRKEITHAYCLRSTNPNKQLIEVLDRIDLYSQIKPFHRYTLCNGKIGEVAKKEINDQLEPKTILYYDKFYRCENYGKIYWKGSHYEKIKNHLSDVLEVSSLPGGKDRSLG